ncbi:MAG: methylated-DNA--[protein]-cysteine S-methyltransferase [Pseudobdellovibrionaceae bacterium]
MTHKLVCSPALSRSDWTSSSVKLKEGIPEELWFGTVPTPLGEMTLVGVDDALCYLGFEENRSLEKVCRFFPKAVVARDDKQAAKMAKTVMRLWEGKETNPVTFIVGGTDFQRSVWKSLMKIPKGKVVSYATVAAAVGRPAAVRAVGTAVGANPISLLIPCHRVVQSNGSFHNYGWGNAMKLQLLTAEKAIA